MEGAIRVKTIRVPKLIQEHTGHNLDGGPQAEIGMRQEMNQILGPMAMNPVVVAWPMAPASCHVVPPQTKSSDVARGDPKRCRVPEWPMPSDAQA